MVNNPGWHSGMHHPFRIPKHDCVGSLFEKDRGKTIHFVQSVVGDDETNTTNSYAFGPVIIGTGPVICGIKVSWKDTGCSKYLSNYAEGWTLTPINGESTFEAVSRHAGNGVPFVLDPVKGKRIEPSTNSGSFNFV